MDLILTITYFIEEAKQLVEVFKLYYILLNSATENRNWD
jgi:hypothetical protein